MSANPGAVINFPAGTYLLNNAASATGLLVPTAFHGTLAFGPGAQLECNTASSSSGQCLQFSGNSNIQVYGLTIFFQGYTYPASSGSPDNALLVGASSNISFINTTINGSPGVGIWNTGSTNISYLATFINSTTEDGIHFENCGNCGTDGTWTNKTGDDAIAFTNITSGSGKNIGGYALNSHVQNSMARGIADAGQANVLVSDFDIETTAGPGIAVIQDPSISSDIPANVKFINGLIEQPGTYCALITDSTYVELSNIKCNAVSSAGSPGIEVGSGSAHVRVHDSEVYSAGSAAFQTSGATQVYFSNDYSYGSLGQGFMYQGCVYCTGSHLFADHPSSYGFFSMTSGYLTLTDLHVLDCMNANPAGYAFSMQTPTGPITTNGLEVDDDQATATCYIVENYMVGANKIVTSGILYNVAHGTPSTQSSGGSAEAFNVVNVTAGVH